MEDTEQVQGLGPADLIALAAATMAIGVAVSAIMIDIGTSSTVVMLATVTAFSGSGELAFAAVILSGGSVAAGLISALLVSSRFGLMAMSIANLWPMPLWERLAAMQLSGEPAVAAALTARNPRTARRLYWQIALAMGIGWVAGSALGTLVGNVIGDTKAIGLDAVFPAVLLGTVAAALRSRDTATAAVSGAMIAVALVPFVPAGVPFLVAALTAVLASRVPAGPLGWRTLLTRGHRGADQAHHDQS